MSLTKNPRRLVKEAFDNLPVGICFFAPSGLPVLCNRTMHRLAAALTGRDLQSLEELRRSLDHPAAAARDGDTYLLSDGTAWHFALSQVTDSQGAPCTQAIAFAVTDLYRGAKEMERNVEQLREVSEHIRNITENVAAVTREEELLAMKMRIHDRLGSSLLKLRRYRLDGGLDKAELLSDWRQSVALLQRAGLGEPEGDLWPELVRSAQAIGVDIVLAGTLPTGRNRDILIHAVRQCMTNAVRHADSDRVFVDVTDGDELLRVRITNNGRAPGQPIREGGGLGALRGRVEAAGGTMQVECDPRFALTITLPTKGGLIL